MQITTNKTELLAALSNVRKALSSHNANPILDGIFLEVTQDCLRLICSDSTMQIERAIHVESKEVGSVVLPGQLFAEISAKMPDEEIEISQAPDQVGVSINSGSFNMSLQGMPTDEYPKMPSISASSSLTISQATLKEMIAKTSFSAAQDQTRPILTGLLFEVEEDDTQSLTVVALSNNRLAIAREACQATAAVKSIIPASSLNKVASILSDDEEKSVTIHFGKTNVFFDLDETKIYCATLAGDFMRYKALIPEQFKTNVYICRKDLNDAITRASLMARENDKKFIRFLIESDSLLISSNSEMGYVRESLPIRATGSELEIAFNAKYISDILNKLDDEQVALRFQSNNVAGVIEPMQGQQYYYLVAPVQI